MTSSAQLEQEAEQTRSELSQTLDELRNRLTPGQLVDQALDYAKDSGGAAFVRNLGQQTVNNPLPIALIGTGLAWLMLSDRNNAGALGNVKGTARSAAERVRRSSAEGTERATDWTRTIGAAARDGVESTEAATGGAAENIKSKLGQKTSSIAESAASVYETARSHASERYDQAADLANRATSKITESADDLRQKTVGATKDLLQICREQPLVLAGLGLAIGAIMGALIPSTETEGRLMGDTSDQIKEKARNIAEDQIDQAKEAVQGKAEQATDGNQLQSHSEIPHSEAPLVPATD